MHGPVCCLALQDRLPHAHCFKNLQLVAACQFHVTARSLPLCCHAEPLCQPEMAAARWVSGLQDGHQQGRLVTSAQLH